MNIESTDTVVIGAGPAGLAVSACLSRVDVAHVVLERDERVGSTWRRHYERLHLHTARELSSLPYRPFPRKYPTYPSRQQVVEYLEDYARHFAIAPRFATEVSRVERLDEEQRWRVEAGEAVLDARHVVVATGYNGVPHRPKFEGMGSFAGKILHSSEYRSGEAFADQNVLVVGAGNSGAEIALDLWEWGARPLLCVRGPIHVMPRDFLGLPTQLTSLALSRLPRALADAIGLRVSTKLFGDLSKFGIVRPEIGPMTMLVEHGRVPLVDVGTVELIRQGEIEVVPAIAHIEPNRVHFVDARVREVDHIVLATGYRPALDRFLVEAERVTNSRGYPTRFGQESELSGLYFVGFRNPPTGQLRDIAHEAKRVARSIRRDR